MHQDPNLRALHRHAQTATDFVIWLRDDPNPLLDAVDLLGGARWVTRTHAVLRAVSAGEPLTRRLSELRAIRNLLALEYAGRRNSDEAARFSEVHPDDPRADTARLCQEAFDRGLAADEALRAAPAFQMREAA